jgi:hypothetical protein
LHLLFLISFFSGFKELLFLLNPPARGGGGEGRVGVGERGGWRGPKGQSVLEKGKGPSGGFVVLENIS